MARKRKRKPFESINASYIKENCIVDDRTGCWLWCWARNAANGYAAIWDGGKLWRGNRLSWIIFRGPIPDGLFVCHKCDTPWCINPDHLFLGTQKDNVQDMMRKNRDGHGSWTGLAHPSAKLTREQVIQIRAERRTVCLAKQFNVSRTTIKQARRGKTYTDVQ